MNTSPVKCNPPLLRRSLEDGLSEQQEEWLATHLDDCVSCQQTLTTLAAGSEGWSQIEIASSDLIKVTDGEFLYTFAAVSESGRHRMIRISGLRQKRHRTFPKPTRSDRVEVIGWIRKPYSWPDSIAEKA